mmetsp:Transcript_14521/g.29229  ORF Transcript_14521/g.29229 Transcript_14521/m.29229 type:complete len:209 (+) Transcript_14521:1845-2471(+)
MRTQAAVHRRDRNGGCRGGRVLRRGVAGTCLVSSLSLLFLCLCFLFTPPLLLIRDPSASETGVQPSLERPEDGLELLIGSEERVETRRMNSSVTVTTAHDHGCICQQGFLQLLRNAANPFEGQNPVFTDSLTHTDLTPISDSLRIDQHLLVLCFLLLHRRSRACPLFLFLLLLKRALLGCRCEGSLLLLPLSVGFFSFIQKHNGVKNS